MNARTFLSLVLSVVSTLPSVTDHLLPSDRGEHLAYYQLLEQLLGTSKFDCGRAIVMPSFEPEYSISLYKTADAAVSSYYVTYFTAETNLWQRTNGGRDSQKAASLKARRIDVAIPETSALILREVWERMLTGSHRPRPTPPPKSRIISFDGTSVEYSLPSKRESILAGELNVSIRPPGKKTTEFVLLTKLLVDYCRASPSRRANFADRIDQKAIALLASLKTNN
jgi:hypothetical protein